MMTFFILKLFYSQNESNKLKKKNSSQQPKQSKANDKQQDALNLNDSLGRIVTPDPSTIKKK